MTKEYWIRYLTSKDFRCGFVIYQFATPSNINSEKTPLQIHPDIGLTYKADFSLDDIDNVIYIRIFNLYDGAFHLQPSTSIELKDRIEITPHLLRAAMTDFDILLTDELLVVRRP